MILNTKILRYHLMKHNMNPLQKNVEFIPGEHWIYYAPDTRFVFGESEINEVVTVLKNGWLGTSGVTQEFEKSIATLFGKKYGLFVNSGSSANLLALEALNLPKGSEIITPACTFNTTVAPIVQRGFVPVFVDTEHDTYQMDARRLEDALSKNTKAVLAPHLIGNFVELERIRDFCKRHKLIFIEDSCDTLGGLYRGKPSGEWSDISTTSFYASHLITAGGAGGMLMTNDKDVLERARVFANWGRGINGYFDPIQNRLAAYEVDGKPYDSAFAFVEAGYSFKPTEMQAAFGLAQLKRLPSFARARKKNFDRLSKFFKQYEQWFILPEPRNDSEVNWLALPLTIRADAPFKRNDLVTFLEQHKIQTRPVFSGNITKHHAYKDARYRAIGKLPNSQLILHNGLLVALHHTLTPPMLDYIEKMFKEFLSNK